MPKEDVDMLSLTADIVCAHLSNNDVHTADIAGLIQSVHAVFLALDKPAEAEPARPEPAVSIRSSVKPDYIICLEDGAKLKMLKRYLRTHFNMSPDEYRAKWGLPRDYPMVAATYSATRQEMARKIGLGRKPPGKAEEADPELTHDAEKPVRKRTSGKPIAATEA